jgi:hypothetical protein
VTCQVDAGLERLGQRLDGALEHDPVGVAASVPISAPGAVLLWAAGRGGAGVRQTLPMGWWTQTTFTGVRSVADASTALIRTETRSASPVAN